MLSCIMKVFIDYCRYGLTKSHTLFIPLVWSVNKHNHTLYILVLPTGYYVGVVQTRCTAWYKPILNIHVKYGPYTVVQNYNYIVPCAWLVNAKIISYIYLLLMIFIQQSLLENISWLKIWHYQFWFRWIYLLTEWSTQIAIT